MKRFPPLDPQNLPPGSEDVAEKILSVSSDGLGGPFNLLLRSPPMARRFIDLLTYFNEDTQVLDPPCRRLAVLVLSRHAGSSYAWWAHRRRAIANGEFPAEVIDAVNDRRAPGGLTEKQSAVVAFVQDLVEPGLTSRQHFYAVRRHLDDAELAELIAFCGTYTAVALILRESEVGLPEGEVDTLKTG